MWLNNEHTFTYIQGFQTIMYVFVWFFVVHSVEIFQIVLSEKTLAAAGSLLSSQSKSIRWLNVHADFWNDEIQNC